MMRTWAARVGGLALVVLACGCGSDSEAGSAATTADSADLTVSPLDGVYRYEVTEEYLTGRGVTHSQAEQEHGLHTVTLSDGQFADAWSNDAMTKTCRGRYTVHGMRMTVRWDQGCTGDWAMTAIVDGDQIHWSAIESLPPEDDPYTRLLNEAFNSVTWTRVGDAAAAEG